MTMRVERDNLSGSLISAMKDGYGWACFAMELTTGGKIIKYFSPVGALIPKLRDNPRLKRLDLFVDWRYYPDIGMMECDEMCRVEIMLFKEREEIANELNKKINRRLFDIIQVNRTSALNELAQQEQGIGEEIHEDDVCVLED